MKQDILEITVPTKNGIAALKTLSEDILNTTEDAAKVKLVFGIDKGDDETIEAVDKYFRYFEYIKVFGEPGRFKGLIVDDLCRVCKGPYILNINQSVRFKSEAWESTILKVISEVDDEFYLLKLWDIIEKDKLATFPVVGKRLLSAIGYIMCPLYERYYIDVHLQDIYKKLLMWGIQKIVSIDSVIIEHPSPHRKGQDTEVTAALSRDWQRFKDMEAHRYFAAVMLMTALRGGKNGGLVNPNPDQK